MIGRPRLGGATAAFAILAIAATACGGGGDREVAERVATSDPASAFAPLVRLDAREQAWPMSAAHFLAHAGLEWNSGRPCYFLDRDLTESGVPLDRPKPAEKASELPLDPRRLGRTNVYRSPPDDRVCDDRNPRVYTSDQPTAPGEAEDRPAGLRLDQGFSLDIDGEFDSGEHRLADDGSLAGVPVYYAREAAGRGILRISYWLLFGRRVTRTRDGLAAGEGGWKRIDVLARRGRERNVFRPIAVEYRGSDRTLRVPWDAADLAGPGGSHPVVQLARLDHTPGPATKCGRCVDWNTWLLTRDVRDEPWWGYGGAWGVFQPAVLTGTTALSGVPGPSP